MRIVSSFAVVSLGLAAIGCDNNTPANPAPNTQAPIVQKAVKPVADALAQQQAEAAKTENNK